MKRHTHTTDHSWYRLDTSAKIYPAIESPENTTVFRISMTLFEEVDEDLLLQALNIVKPRFPYYNVYLRTGLFWNYFERNDSPSVLWPETPTPCERLYPVYNNGYRYLVRIYGKRISVEFSHVLTDGTGGIEFLKTLVAHYLLLKGKLSGIPDGILDINEEPLPEEYQDAFLKVLEIEKENLSKEPHTRALFNTDAVFKMRDRLLPLGNFKIITGTVALDQIKALAKQHDVKITELLAALYVEALIRIQHEQKKDTARHRPIGMEIPVNMRNLYPIRSMRNFSLFVVPRFDPRKIEKFEDITSFLKSYMETHVTRDYLLTMVQDNCALGENNFIRHTPVNVKNFVIRYLSNTQGHAQFSGTISNLGAIRLPVEMEAHIDDFGVLLGPSVHSLTSCGVLGFKDRIHINFGRVCREPRVERHIFRRLVEMGVQVSITSN
ncbi:MAG: hypothetical protein JXR21_03875 [Candidatus Marinimicrobia bacterium]|nr:hypothetical protein [Candidatus Neomarinimicrobiota bacterium]